MEHRWSLMAMAATAGSGGSLDFLSDRARAQLRFFTSRR
jgi:hypothetical protein